ncbi:putative restriction endonuclease [Kitasatospora sp. MAP12-15]|uniref:HNH endonuclease n=1 Tax=unclassified Kitasatospora TaxID=2633591 RepID=UPI0024759F7F|nr:HNH endonuclease [Kitasatospora sp. MAP12-44]MDH6111637.1 putative restriction endonuclease [Kitasatospora sp. MAP12-44]
MGIEGLTSREAVLQALKEFDSKGRDSFLEKHGFDETVRHYVHHCDRLYDAQAIAAVAYGYQHPGDGPLSAAQVSAGPQADSVSPLLRNLDFTVLDDQTTTTPDELAWRQAIWANLQARRGQDGLLSARDIRAVGAYGGQQGIWVDKVRTERVNRRIGVTVALKHTGVDYPDDLREDGMLYHYPVTKRGGHDLAEVNATKATAQLKLPVFAISQRGDRRSVRLAWVEGWDDAAKMFFVSYGNTPPEVVLDADHSDDQPFVLEGNRSRSQLRNVRTRPDQTRFKFKVIQRYGARCPLSGVEVSAMLEAAHLRGDADNGSPDARNGLPMNAALHRAFDLHLFAIHPDTLEVELRPQGPTLKQLGIIQPRLDGLPNYPHRDALDWRYRAWQADVAKKG